MAPPSMELLEAIDLVNIKTLVVDDSPTALKHITRILTSIGIENITVDDFIACGQ